MTGPCLWVARDQRRVLADRHLRDCNASGCAGCQPCRERHCTAAGCPGRHLTASERLTCAKCVGYVRDDLALIADLAARPIAREAEHRGVTSEAAMLAGPAAEPGPWGRQAAAAAIAGGAVADYLRFCGDELHPLWVLGTWDMFWREHLEHPTGSPVTVGAAAAYLASQLTYMAQQVEPDFAQFADEIRTCRSHLENVLRDGERSERGARCPVCDSADLVKEYGETEVEDRWVCPGKDSAGKDCTVSYTEGDYRAKVDAVYVEHAPKLNYTDLEATYRVPAGSVRGWAALGKVRRYGKRNGRQLYDVADVLAMRDQSAEAAL